MDESKVRVIYQPILTADKSCFCWRCRYTWVSRKKDCVPAICPRCKSMDWFQHREFQCQQCGHIFKTGNIYSPVYSIFPNCPKCNRTDWHREVEDKLHQIYEDGMKHYEQSNWRLALPYFQEIMEISPNYKVDAKKLETTETTKITITKLYSITLENKLHQIYEDGMKHYEQSNWRLALPYFQEIMKINPNYKDVAKKLETTETTITKLYSIAGVMPKDIEVSRVNFGDYETTLAATVILDFCKHRGNWDPFTFQEINMFYVSCSKYNRNKTFSLGKNLLKQKYIRVPFLSLKLQVTEKFVKKFLQLK